MHHPSTCHPAVPGVPWERTRISYFMALPAATYVALRKESRKKSTEATVFDRKSGEGEGPAVRPCSHTNVSFRPSPNRIAILRWKRLTDGSRDTAFVGRSLRI